MSYRLISENRGVYFYFNGDVNFKDIRRASADGWEHQNRDHNIFQIWDYCDVNKFYMEQMEAVLSSRMDNIAFGNIGHFTKIAIIATHPDIINKYVIYRKYIDQNLLDVDIFLCEEDARQWVAMPDSENYYVGLECHA